MKSFYYESKMSFKDVLVITIVATIIIFIVGNLEGYSLYKMVFLSLLSFALSFIWSNMEIKFQWQSKEEVKPLTLHEAKKKLTGKIMGESAWTTRTPQEQELNSILQNSINKIDLAVEEVEGAVKDFIKNNNTK